jgi:ABC-2 type transport system ATP-binding protein
MLALSLKNLKKTYANGLPALKGINLDVKEKDFFALLGPNGAGKSTTIGIICSLVLKNSGTVTVFGDSLDEFPQKVKAAIGMVPQEFNFNPFDSVEDILYYQACYYGLQKKLAYQRIEKILKDIDLWNKRKSCARELSGGMKRRLMIARALVHEPKLLILDEPTAGVDIELRRSMWEFLKKLNQSGTTIILTTHYLEEAEQLCNRIAIIHQGDIVENTDMKTLLSQLNTQTLVLDLQKAREEKLQLLNFPTRLIDPLTLEVDINKSQNLNTLFEELSQQKIQVHSLRYKANRLEEIFVNTIRNTKKHHA